MKVEKEAEYYNHIFESNSIFNVHYKDSPYWVHWTQVLKYLGRNKNLRLLEIGCGTGQLAEYLKDEGHLNYIGFDFSNVAIKKAKERVPEFKFYVGNALEKDNLNVEFDVAICLEVLEHVKNDIAILKNIPLEKTLIFSLPNFFAESHVRWFISERQIKSRYYKLLDIKNIVKIGNIYVCYAIRSDFRSGIFNMITKSREEFNYKAINNRIIHYYNNVKTYFQK